MRITLFTSSYPPRVGGVETVSHRLAQELVRRGHEVDVITHRYPRDLPSRECRDGLEVRRRMYPDLLPHPGRRSMRVIMKSLAALPLAAFELLYLCGYLLRRRPDVVSAHYLSAPVAYCLLASKLMRVPLVLSFHGSDAARVPYPSNYAWTVRIALALSEHVIACSRNLLAYLMKSAPQGVRGSLCVVHYGVDVPPQYSSQIDQQVVLLASRLVPKKGVDVAIRAIAILRDRGIRVRLDIAGDGPLRPQLGRLVHELELNEQVRFLGSVPHGNMASLIEGCSFVLLTSWWEAFGMIVLEAMAAGKAVIASANGGPAEIIVDGETGLLVPAGDVIGFATAIRQLWEDRGRASAMGIRARLRVQEGFTWSRMAGAYETAFRQALNNSPASIGAGA